MVKTLPGGIFTVLRSRRGQRNLRVLAVFSLVLAAMIVAFTVTFHHLMLREGQEHSWLTGLYWTLTVMSTLGFGDITFHTDLGRAFSMLVLLSGMIFLLVLLPFTFIEFFYEPWMQARAESRAPRRLPETIEGHRDDDVNVYLAVYCRRLRPDAQIVARATHDRNVPTLHRAGADMVLSYASMGAGAIMDMLKKSEILTVVEGLDLFRATVARGLAGKTIAESSIREQTGCSVVAIRTDVGLQVIPDPSEVLTQGQDMILIGTSEAEQAFLRRFGEVPNNARRGARAR